MDKKKAAQTKSANDGSAAQLEEAPSPNRTGMPDRLKAGVEGLSGMSLDDVTVHYNSDKPAQLNALAYAQGSDIHVAPGEEKHLPHEAWHIVQQRQGRVRPTMQMKAGVPVNDNAGLEKEADVMGAKAMTTTEPRHITQASPIAREMPLQRLMTVQHIDYNPVTNQYRDGFIHQANFLTALRDEINNVARWTLYRGQVANVINALRATADAANQGDGMLGPDVPTLATTITTEVVNEYTQRGLAGISGQRAHLQEAVVRLLAANIRPDVGAGVGMNAQEGNAYDALRTIATDANMSRVKGTANTLQYNQLPGPLSGAVNTVLTGIRNERAYWNGIGIRSLNISYFLPPPNELFNVDVRNSPRLHSYQGNHTNNAGWLPAAAAPASPLNARQAAILAAATPALLAILNAGNPLPALGIQKGAAPNAQGQEFIGHVTAARRAITTADILTSAGSAMAQGVSAYVEFNMPTDISRLVWNTVNGRIYVSAHYKWRAGFNPWFQITGFPAI